MFQNIVLNDNMEILPNPSFTRTYFYILAIRNSRFEGPDHEIGQYMSDMPGRILPGNFIAIL